MARKAQAKGQSGKQSGNRFAGVFETPVVTIAPPRTRGRSGGKHSDGDYDKYGVYLRKTTHRAMKLTLEMRGGEISEAFEEWCQTWLREQHGVDGGEADPGRVVLERMGAEIPE